MNLTNRFLTGISLLFVCTAFAASALAQDDEREERDNQKTKQAQAVSKEVYDRIQRAQELIDADDQRGALSILNSLLEKKGITEYEQQNILNYIGFVNYNLDNIPAAIAASCVMKRPDTSGLLRLCRVEDRIPT
jgi:outer membrane protein assembly factor BamD (BamD/ComL family)